MSKQTFNYIEHNLLKILSSNSLLIPVLVLNLLTISTSLWTIFKFDLINDARLNRFIIQKNDSPGLKFAKDVNVDTLIPENLISLSKINARKVSLSSGPQLDQLGLQIGEDHIVLQAQDFYMKSEPIEDFDFVIPTRLNIIEIKNGLNEITNINSNMFFNNEPLQVVSKGFLELNGNRGLTISGKRLNIISSDKISLKSRWENLSIFAMKGVCLPNLINAKELSGISNDKSELRMNICVEKISGRINLCQITQ